MRNFFFGFSHGLANEWSGGAAMFPNKPWQPNRAAVDGSAIAVCSLKPRYTTTNGDTGGEGGRVLRSLQSAVGRPWVATCLVGAMGHTSWYLCSSNIPSSPLHA